MPLKKQGKRQKGFLPSLSLKKYTMNSVEKFIVAKNS